MVANAPSTKERRGTRMRLTKEKLLKNFNRIEDEINDDKSLMQSIWEDNESGDVWLEPMHIMAVVPHNLDLLFAHDRATKFTGRIRKVFAQQNWVALGEAPSQKLLRTIRDNKTSPKTYAHMLIDNTLLDTSFIHNFIKHYQRGTDYIQFYSCGKDKPIAITSNANEWMCIVAPRIEEFTGERMDEEPDNGGEWKVLFSPPKDVFSDAPTLTTTTPKTFNPLTGVFE